MAISDFHLVELVLVHLLVGGLLHHGGVLALLKIFEELSDVVLDLLLFLFQFVMVCFRFLLLVAVCNHKVNVFLFTFLEF